MSRCTPDSTVVHADRSRCSICREVLAEDARAFQVMPMEIWGGVARSKLDVPLTVCGGCLEPDVIGDALKTQCPVTHRAHFFRKGDASGLGMSPWVECSDCGLEGDLYAEAEL